VHLRSLIQLHSYRGRQGGVLGPGLESCCPLIGLRMAAKPKRSGFVGDQRSEPTLAIAMDAVSDPTTRSAIFGGSHGAREGSIPSSTTTQLYNDRVVQRRRAGQRRQDRPAGPLLLRSEMEFSRMDEGPATAAWDELTPAPGELNSRLPL
jgi:hypothetical protein